MAVGVVRELKEILLGNSNSGRFYFRRFSRGPAFIRNVNTVCSHPFLCKKARNKQEREEKNITIVKQRLEPSRFVFIVSSMSPTIQTQAAMISMYILED